MPLCKHLYALMHAAANSGHVDNNVTDVTTNTSGAVWHVANRTSGVLEGDLYKERAWILHEFRLIKVAVLVTVISILLLSTCRILLKTNARFPTSRKPDMDMK